MSDWQIGDVAVCVAEGRAPCPHSTWMTHRGDNGLRKGATGRVASIYADRGDKTKQPCGCLVLVLDNGQSGITSRFRKIRPDEREACELEFVTLLKRSKEPATASDWLLSVKDLARQLNEQSRRDPREREAGSRLPANQ